MTNPEIISTIVGCIGGLTGVFSLIQLIKDRAIKDTQFKILTEQLAQQFTELRQKLAVLEGGQTSLLVDVAVLKANAENQKTLPRSK